MASTKYNLVLGPDKGGARRRLLGCMLSVGLTALLAGACSVNNDISTGPSNSGVVEATPNGTGGASIGGGVSTSTGGLSAISTGGTQTNNTGGALSTGGRSNSTTGGKASTGGALATGGRVNTGGATSSLLTTGGATAIPMGTGGKLGTGGKAATGGALATGGNSATGGTVASATGGSASTCTPSSTKFSFFVTSQSRLFALAQAFNGSTKGFGGDLRYGQSTGLAGADKICTAIAEASMPGNCKTWRAFLSASNGGSGTAVNAISRIGTGPWYDRIGRLFGTNTTSIAATRPDANSAIVNDLPNEDGVLNHDALQTGSTANQDNHDTLTGSTTTGTLYSETSNCTNWTSSAASTSAKPRVGHTWPAMSGQSWISCLDESGCGPGSNLIETGGPGKDGTVGSGGGYGGFYCFALTP